MEIEILELENIIEVQQIKEFLQPKPELLEMFEIILSTANQKIQEKDHPVHIKKNFMSESQDESSSSDEDTSDEDYVEE
jgi:hypothetical protein